MKVTLINGSAALESHTAAHLKYIEEKLTKKGADVTVVNLRDWHLPIVMTEYHQNPIETPNASVRTFVKQIAASDAIILASPLYHGSFSGLLKNAMDSLKGDALRGRIVGLVSNAGGMKSPQALEHLRSVVRTMYGYATQTQVATSNADFSESKIGFTLTDEDTKNRTDRLIDEMLFLTEAINKPVLTN